MQRAQEEVRAASVGERAEDGEGQGQSLGREYPALPGEGRPVHLKGQVLPEVGCGGLSRWLKVNHTPTCIARPPLGVLNQCALSCMSREGGRRCTCGTGPRAPGLYILRWFSECSGSPVCSCVSLSSLRMSYGNLLCARVCLPTRVCAYRDP